MPLRILWSYQHVLAVWKPPGMPVQSDKTGDPDLLTLLQAQAGEQRLFLTHRLDRPVSGVVLVARSAEAAAWLNAQFRERSVQKIYWAIVEGVVTSLALLEGTIRHDAGTRKARMVAPGSSPANARLRVVPLASGDRYTLLEVMPEGGAFHQIRAQLAAAGSPIKGDVKYGARRGEKDRSIALHARSIRFVDPQSRQAHCVEAPTPESPIWLAFQALMSDHG